MLTSLTLRALLGKALVKMTQRLLADNDSSARVLPVFCNARPILPFN